jgi:hypothetical protein
MLCSFELGAYGDDWPEGLPAELRSLLRVLDDDSPDPVLVGAAMVEKFTAVLIQPSALGAMDRVCRVTPRLERLWPFDQMRAYQRFHRHQWVLEAMRSAPPEYRRAVGEWAARATADRYGVAEQPGFSELIAQFGRASAIRPSTEFVRLVDDTQRRLAEADRVGLNRSRPDYQALNGLSHVLTAFRHLSVADAEPAGLGAVWFAWKATEIESSDAMPAFWSEVAARLDYRGVIT